MSRPGLGTLLPILAILTSFVVVPLIFAPSGTVYNYLGAGDWKFPDRGYVEMVFEPIKETVAVFLLGIAALFSVWRANGDRSGSRFFLTLIVVGLWSSCLFALNLFSAVESAVYVSALVSFPLFSYRLFDSKRLIGKAASVLCLGGVFTAIYTLCRLMMDGGIPIGIQTTYLPFLEGDTLGSQHRTGMYLAALIPVFVYVGTRRPLKGLRNLWFVLLAFIVGLVFYLSRDPRTVGVDDVFERGWVVALVAAVGLLYALVVSLVRARRSGRAGSRALRIVLLAVLVLFFVGTAYIGYIHKPDVEIRVTADELTSDSLKMFKDNFIWGTGPGNWDRIFPYFHSVVYDPEWIYRIPTPKSFDYIRVPLEWGLIGTIGFIGLILWLLVVVLRSASRPTSDDEDAGASAGGAVGLAVATLFARPFAHAGIQSLFWFLVGLAVAYVSFPSRCSVFRPATGGYSGVLRKVGAAVSLVVFVVYCSTIRIPDYMAVGEHMLGMFSIKKGVQANAPFQRAINLSPKCPEIRVDKAEQTYLVDVEEINKAREVVNNPDREEAFRSKARDEIKQAAERIEQECRTALATSPNDASVLFRLGMGIYFQKIDSKETILAWENAARLSPKTPAIRTSLAKCYVAGNENLKALEHWNAALEADPENVTALTHKAEYLYSHGRSDEAVDLYQQARRLMKSGRRGGAEALAKIEELMKLRFGEEELKKEKTPDPLENRLASLLKAIREDPEQVDLYYYAAIIADRLSELYTQPENKTRGETLKGDAVALYRAAASRGHKGAAEKLIEKGLPLK